MNRKIVRFKKWKDGMIHILGNGKVVFYSRDDMVELHDKIHELFGNEPIEISEWKKRIIEWEESMRARLAGAP